MSIFSAPERGPWGDNRYRGNCSGHIYQAVFSHLKPKVFIDPTVGSGTSVEVAKEMGIEAYGLDLRFGFNALRQSILKTVGKHADLVMSHPPYADMIVYSGSVWGEEKVSGDLSHLSLETFLEGLQLLLLNQRTATRIGGYYATLLGDLRRKGSYTSLQAKAITGMPEDELAAVLIKAQHNMTSNSRDYNLTMPRIEHEYILVWQKKERSGLSLIKTLVAQSQKVIAGSWRNVVKLVLMGLGGQANLETIYRAVAYQAADKLAANQHWKAKVRQTLQRSTEFASCERGTWVLV
jgi:hypothetical protein